MVGLPFLPLSMYEPYWIVAADLEKEGMAAFISEVHSQPLRVPVFASPQSDFGSLLKDPACI